MADQNEEPRPSPDTPAKMLARHLVQTAERLEHEAVRLRAMAEWQVNPGGLHEEKTDPVDGPQKQHRGQ